MATVTGQQGGHGRVEVQGLTQFINELRQGRERGYVDAELKKANDRVAKIVIRTANRIASSQGKMNRKAAGSLDMVSTATAVRVIGGGRDVPYFGGANFGSYRDTRRLVKKSKRGSRRGRATLVRAGEDIDVVARRVERQRDPRSGRQVELARTKGGAYRVIRGWNQFGSWRRGRDNFLFAAVTREYSQIQKYYLQMLESVSGRAFPE